jgi:hypothetical protein
MSDNVTKIGERFLSFKQKDETYLGIPTGIKGGHHALKALTSLKNEPGWIVKGNLIDEWRFIGFTRINGEVCLYGPYLKGTALDEVLELNPEQGLPYVKKLIEALLLLKERSFQLFSFETDSVLFLDDGGVFFFPRPIMSKIRNSRSENYRIQAYEIITHPYLNGEERACFTIAILLYRLLTDSFPFTDNSEDGVRAKIRNLDAISPYLVRPDLKKELSDAIMNTFNKSKSYNLEDWHRIVSSWIQDGIYREISSEERELLLSKAQEQREKTERTFRKKLFWEKNGRLILIIAALVVVGGFVIGSFVKNALAPRITKGFSPIQVVKAFYESINRLDHMTMEDCVIQKAGKAEINEVVHLYVIGKQTMAYEGKSYIVPADKWAEDGRPELLAPFFVYGTVDLEVTEERGAPEPVYTVTYEKWSRKISEEKPMESEKLYTGYKVKDRLFLKQNRGDWVIFQIDRLEFVPIEE